MSRLFMIDPTTGRKVLATGKRQGRTSRRCVGGLENLPPHPPVKPQWRPTDNPGVDLLVCPRCELVVARRTLHPAAITLDPTRRKRLETYLAQVNAGLATVAKP